MLPGVAAHPAVGGPGFDMSLIPGFDIIQKLFLKFGLDPSLLVTIGMSLTVLTSLLSFFTYSIGSLTTLGRFISANFISSATIHSSDVTYLYIMKWLADQQISTDCRLFCVTSRKNPQSHAVKRYSSYSSIYGDGPRDDDEDEEEDMLGPKLKYTPAPGTQCFLYKGKHLVFLHRKLDLSYYTGEIPDETIVLTTIGRSPNLLRTLLTEARHDYLQAQASKTMVYTLSPTSFTQKWDQGRHRTSRDISTVIMPKGSKEALLRDVREYLNPITARWYTQRGLPYRRGYLFYGPPGTGKTSLSLALAGELKVPLYILSLSTGSLTDESLTSLFVGLPRKCIVLLEDIDCAGIQRIGKSAAEESDSSDSSDDEYTDSESESNSSGKAKKAKKTPPPPPSRSRSSVSFSGLLNAIDGVASHEGRILIMTTNHRERLDPALIRPGRVDVQVELGFAGKEILAEIFRELYSNVDGIEEQRELFGSENSSLLGAAEEKNKESYKKEIATMAEEFASKIPGNVYTPAEIQGFLMSYKRRHIEALSRISDWVKDKKKQAEAKNKRTSRNRKRSKKSPFPNIGATPAVENEISSQAERPPYNEDGAEKVTECVSPSCPSRRESQTSTCVHVVRAQGVEVSIYRSGFGHDSCYPDDECSPTGSSGVEGRTNGFTETANMTNGNHGSDKINGTSRISGTNGIAKETNGTTNGLS